MEEGKFAMKQKKKDVNTLPPLIIGRTRLTKLLGVSKQKVKEVLLVLGVEPIPGIGSEGREKYSYPQILNRLENINQPTLVRRRAFRQPEMKRLFDNTIH